MQANADTVETVRADMLVAGDVLFYGFQTPSLRLCSVARTPRGAVKVIGSHAAIFLQPEQLVKRHVRKYAHAG